MARIGRSEYPKIQRMAEVEKRKVLEIAALYGCTPANIYGILAKLRKEGGGGAQMVSPELTVVEQPAAVVAPPAETGCPESEKASGDLFAALDHQATSPAQPEAESLHSEVPSWSESQSSTAVALPAEAQTGEPLAEASIPTTTPELRPAPPPPAKTGSRGRSAETFTAEPRLTKASKPGFALCMRTSDGDEFSTPFRSLDDLLSAARPILRSAARSPDPIWFSIQPINLADLDSEAA